MATARDLINRAKSAPDTFDVMLSGDEGDVLKVRNIRDLRLVTARKEKAKDLLKINESETCHPSWKPFLPITAEIADVMAALVIDAVEPTFTDLEALELCATNGVLAAVIYTQIQQQMLQSLAKNEIEQIKSEKNALPPIGSSAPTSLSAKSHRSTSTPTTSAKGIGHTLGNTSR